MKSFTYVVQDAIGLHARPAGMLVKEAKKFSSMITVQKGEKTAGALKLMALMGLGVKCCETIVVSADGEDEEAAICAMQTFFAENL